jgi:hypothetical protein
VAYSSIGFASSDGDKAIGPKQVECSDHGTGFATYACEHLISNPAQEWFSREPDDEDKWPDAWCAACDSFFQEQGEWNEKNESEIKIELLCHQCYENCVQRVSSLPQKFSGLLLQVPVNALRGEVDSPAKADASNGREPDKSGVEDIS